VRSIPGAAALLWDSWRLNNSEKSSLDFVEKFSITLAYLFDLLSTGTENDERN